MLEAEASVTNIFISNKDDILKKKESVVHIDAEIDTLAAKSPHLLRGGSGLRLLFIGLDF